MSDVLVTDQGSTRAGLRRHHDPVVAGLNDDRLKTHFGQVRSGNRWCANLSRGRRGNAKEQTQDKDAYQTDQASHGSISLSRAVSRRNCAERTTLYLPTIEEDRVSLAPS